MAVRSKYQPFSFQERITPLLMLKEEHEKINEGLTSLGEAANQYYQFLDPEAKKVVDQYNQQLNDIAGSLASEGMKAVSRNTLNNLRRAYSSQIKPIQEAAQTVGTIQAQIREMAMKDPTLMVQSVPTVSDIMKNPNAKPSVVSGTQLMQEGATAALMLPGVDYEALSKYLQGDISAIPDLEKATQRIAAQYGVSDEQALGYISRGIMSGLGKRATELDMKQQEADIQFDKQMKLARYNAGVQAARQRETIAANKEARDATMLASGFVPDANAPGGYVYDEDLARSILTNSKGKAVGGSGSGGRSSAQYMNRTKGVKKYDGEGKLISHETTVSSSDKIDPVNDIVNAPTDVQVLALKHANIPIGSKETTPNGYDAEAIKKLVREYQDVLDSYRFYVTRSGKKVKNFWGEETSQPKIISGDYNTGLYTPEMGYEEEDGSNEI